MFRKTRGEEKVSMKRNKAFTGTFVDSERAVPGIDPTSRNRLKMRRIGMKPLQLKRRGKPGQTMLEFVLTFLLFSGLIVMLAMFLWTFKSYGGRILDLVASEYP